MTNVIGSKMRMGVVAVVGVAALAAGTLFGSAGEAEAFSASKSGQPGSVTITTQVYGTATWLNAGLQFGTYSAQRSPSYASSTQRICMELRVWRTTGGTVMGQPVGWTRDWNSSTDYWCANRAPGQGAVQFPAVNHAAMSGFGYTVQVNFTWAVGSTIIAQQLVDYVHTYDYRCSGGNAPCWVATHAGRGVIWLLP